MVEGNPPVSDNDWETVKSGGPAAIKKWIAGQMHGRSCTVVLVGSNTAGRPMVKHEIIESWNNKMGVVGIHIHGLKNLDGKIFGEGQQPVRQHPLRQQWQKTLVDCEVLQPSGEQQQRAIHLDCETSGKCGLGSDSDTEG